MKSLNARKLLFLFLIVASIGSYTYMNVTAPDLALVYGSQDNMDLFEEEVKKDAMLPDVRILQKVIETGKRILPPSR